MKVFCGQCGWDGSGSPREAARMRHLQSIRILAEADRRRAERLRPPYVVVNGQPVKAP